MLPNNPASPRVAVIPSECPKFVAACLTCGVEFENGTPRISNVYHKGRIYDPEEPGEIKFYLSDSGRVNPMAVAKVWLNPGAELAECSQIIPRLLAATSTDDLREIAADAETLILSGPIARMSRFAWGKDPIASRDATPEERGANEALDEAVEKMKTQPLSAMLVKSLVAVFSRHWEPAMQAWLRAWLSNYLDMRESWRAGHQAIRIDRGDRMPLLIPKGPKAIEMLRRWL